MISRTSVLRAAVAQGPPPVQRCCPRRRPPQPPLATRPDANGRGVQIGLRFSQLAQLGPGGALQAAVTKVVKIGRRLGEGFADDAEAPDVVLFEPAEHPGAGCL